MKNKFLFIIILLFSYQYSSYWYEAIKNISWNNKCYYKVEWTKYDNTSYIKDWSETNCDTSIDFNSLWIPDWVYNLYLKWDDRVTLWDTKSYSWETNITKSNKQWIKVFWPYKVDTTAPSCLLKEIRFLAWESNNQYYNSWKFYYKSTSPASWKFELLIESDDTSNWVNINTSKIQKIEFPTILWAKPNTQTFTNSWKVLVVWRYEWSWSQNDAFDILNNSSKIFCHDNAWNSSYLFWSINTKVVFEDWSSVTWIPSLILTPDWTIPTVSWTTYSEMTNWIEYKTWNDWLWSYSTIYAWNTSVWKYIAALNNREIKLPTFRDTWSWLKTFQVKIEKSDDKNYPINNVSYKKQLSWTSSLVNNLTDTSVIHDFSLVDIDLSSNGYRNYSWDIETLDLWWNVVKTNEICDMVWNCIPSPTPDFKVIANSPILALNTNILWWNKWTKHNLNDNYNWNSTNMRANLLDTHNTLVYFEDKYWNYIVPVTWVKNIRLNIEFENTLWCNQYSGSWVWDCVDFTFKNWSNNLLNWSVNPSWSEFKNFNYTFDNYNQFDWLLKINLKSAIPTKDEYTISWTSNSLYWDLTAKLQLNNLQIKVDNLLVYSWIWENASYFNIANSPSNKPIYKWDPIINYNLLWTIYPLVEWQEKTIDLWKITNDSTRLTNYELETKLWTNNFFLQFNNIKLTNWNIKTWWMTTAWSEKYYVVKNSPTSLIDWYWKIPSWSDLYNFIPKTIWWINNSSTKIALYSILNYEVWWKIIKIPSVQSWFEDNWIHIDSDFSNNSLYNNDSNITLSEIDIRWITQTRTTTLWTSAWSWAVTTDNATYKDISSIKLYDLKTQVNKNVEKILAWSDKTKWTEWSNTITSFDFSIQWWLKLNNNNIIYFKDRDVTIDCSNTCNISGKKTIIVENGNIILKDNLKYSDNNSILWIILVWNKDWSKSQLRISEEITNWVWIVYSEWPIVSVNPWNTKLYDWTNTSNTNLVNQLYWKWSFASRNTVWWSIKDNKWVCPYWTLEYNKTTCTIEKAQWYDLIYLRRYARINAWLYWITWIWPMWDSKVPVNLDKIAIKTAWGHLYSKVVSWNSTKTTWNLPEPEKNNLNAPLILEFDSKIQTSPPPWFSNN